ncbi:MAG TPA: DUF4292 domain-containing protein [Flavobacterium sp.]|jgi:hypothetical protein
MRKYILFLTLAFLVSCKSKAVLAEGTAGKALTAEKIIAGHYSNKKNFTTLSIRANAKYRDAEQSQNVTADIKIKKDEKILVSIRFLGITMAKAMITPKDVRYYEKINGNFFEGDYTTLSQWLGTDLDFFKVQNLLIGQAMDDLTKGNYKNTIDGKLYKLESASDQATQKDFYFEAVHFLVKKQELEQAAKGRMLKVEYPAFKQYGETTLPVSILIEALQPKGKTNINIEYTSVTINEEISFPYSVPEGYERIFID